MILDQKKIVCVCVYASMRVCVPPLPCVRAHTRVYVPLPLVLRLNTQSPRWKGYKEHREDDLPNQPNSTFVSAHCAQGPSRGHLLGAAGASPCTMEVDGLTMAFKEGQPKSNCHSRGSGNKDRGRERQKVKDQDNKCVCQTEILKEGGGRERNTERVLWRSKQKRFGDSLKDNQSERKSFIKLQQRETDKKGQRNGKRIVVLNEHDFLLPSLYLFGWLQFNSVPFSPSVHLFTVTYWMV